MEGGGFGGKGKGGEGWKVEGVEGSIGRGSGCTNNTLPVIIAYLVHFNLS